MTVYTNRNVCHDLEKQVQLFIFAGGYKMLLRVLWETSESACRCDAVELRCPEGL